MSSSDMPSPPPPPDPSGVPPPPPRSGCLTAFMVIFGVILLLPGLCALIFGIGAMTDPRVDPSLMSLVVLGLLVGFGGVMLIRAALRSPSR